MRAPRIKLSKLSSAVRWFALRVAWCSPRRQSEVGDLESLDSHLASFNAPCVAARRSVSPLFHLVSRLYINLPHTQSPHHTIHTLFRCVLTTLMTILPTTTLCKALSSAAAEKLGTSMASTIKPQDRELFTAGSNAMADAIREAKEQLTKRKAEVGEAAALSKLDASIRSEAAGVEARGILTARPKLWLLDRDGCLNEDVGAPGVVRSDDLRLISRLCGCGPPPAALCQGRHHNQSVCARQGPAQC